MGRVTVTIHVTRVGAAAREATADRSPRVAGQTARHPKRVLRGKPTR